MGHRDRGNRFFEKSARDQLRSRLAYLLATAWGEGLPPGGDPWRTVADDALAVMEEALSVHFDHLDALSAAADSPTTGPPPGSMPGSPPGFMPPAASLVGPKQGRLQSSPGAPQQARGATSPSKDPSTDPDRQVHSCSQRDDQPGSAPPASPSGVAEEVIAAVLGAGEVIYRMSPTWSLMRTLSGRGWLKDTETPSQSWLQRYIPAEDRAEVLAVVGECVASGRPFAHRHRVYLADGSIGWTYSRALPVLDPGGRVIEWVGVASNC